MKKYFITGLVILLPLALTLAILAFIFNFLTDPFVGIVQRILDYVGLLDSNFFFLSAQQLQVAVSRVIILVLLFFFTVFLGFVGRWFFFHYFVKFWDNMIQRIPFVRAIYKTCQDVIKTLFGEKTNAFQQVVLVPFPHLESYSIALVTRDNIAGWSRDSQDNIIAVFVPTTPNPTSGFLVLYKAKDVIYLDMKVEDAMKFVISCGVIQTPFKLMPNDKLIAE